MQGRWIEYERGENHSHLGWKRALRSSSPNVPANTTSPLLSSKLPGHFKLQIGLEENKGEWGHRGNYRRNCEIMQKLS